MQEKEFWKSIPFLAKIFPKSEFFLLFIYRQLGFKYAAVNFFSIGMQVPIRNQWVLTGANAPHDNPNGGFKNWLEWLSIKTCFIFGYVDSFWCKVAFHFIPFLKYLIVSSGLEMHIKVLNHHRVLMVRGVGPITCLLRTCAKVFNGRGLHHTGAGEREGQWHKILGGLLAWYTK